MTSTKMLHNNEKPEKKEKKSELVRVLSNYVELINIEISLLFS